MAVTTQAATQPVKIESKEGGNMPLTIKDGVTVSAVTEALKTHYPAVYEAINTSGYEQGYSEGQANETARVKSVFEQSMPGHDTLIKALALDGVTTGEQAAVKVLTAERQTFTDYLDTSSKDAPNDVVDVAEGQEISKMNGRQIAKAATELVKEEASQGRSISYSQAVKQVTGAC